MKSYLTKDIRNVVLIGGSKSGKTTVAESMLFEGKVIDRRGSVEAKNTVSDNTEFEQTNQKSVYATPLYAEVLNTKFNIIDAPGSDDFSGGALSAFKVCENAILVVNGAQGVEVGTEIFARYAKQYGVPMIIAVNQLDAEKADWDHSVASLKEAFGSKIALVQFPVNPGPGFNGIVDVITEKFYNFKDENGTCEVLDIPAEYADQAEEMRAELMEKAAEGDDDLMMKFFDTMELTTDEIRAGLRAGYLKGEIMPVFAISGKKDVGVKRLMEFTINVGVSPLGTVAKTKEGGEILCDPNGPVSLFIYKTAVEQHLGDVAYFKVMSGVLNEGADLTNPETGNNDRLSAIYAVAGAKKEKVSSINAGDIGCVMKLKNSKTDVTLAAPGVDPIEHMKFPDAKYRCAVKAVDKNDEAKVGEALNKIAAQDPTIIVEYSKELRQTILSGQGEQHINLVKWRVKNEFKLDIELFAPKVPYRETITKVATAQYRHKKQSGGAGQFGEVHLIVEPYTEGMEKKPLGVYGETKSLGEDAVQKEMTQYYILRTAWLYGFEGKNFVYTMTKLMNSKSELSVVNDQKGTPTNAFDLANVVIKIIQTSDNAHHLFGKNSAIPYGIYQYTNLGEITWFDFAKKIFEFGKKYGRIEANCQILPCSTEDYPTPAKRPAYSVLSKEKIQKALKVKIPNWDDSLEKFIKSNRFSIK